MLNKFLNSILVVFFLCSLSSCSQSNRHIRKGVECIFNCTIALPDTMIMICDGEKHIVSTHQYNCAHKLLFYYSPQECSTCAVSSLSEFEPLFRLDSKLKDFRLIVLFIPKPEDLHTLIEKLENKKYPNPVFIDYRDDFTKLNPSLPEDRIFHSILIDGSGNPLLVGNPLYSDSLWRMFTNIINYTS